MKMGIAGTAPLVFAAVALAGTYPSGEKCPFEISPDGAALPLSFGTDSPGVFNLKMARLADLGDLNPARANNPDRAALLKAVPVEKDPAAQAANWLRLRNFDAALNRLAPLARGRNADFRLLATLAHAHALRGEWSEAVLWHESARLDTDFPTELPGYTPAQQKWVRRVEFEFYPKWLALKRDEAARKVSPDRETVFPLFGTTPLAGEGATTPLPADAVAIVQQLLLWDRDDTRLFWLLGELYAADGKLREADAIFDQCASEARQYSNRPALMARRAGVKRLVQTLPPPALATLPEEPPPAEPDLGVSTERFAAVAVVCGTLALLLAFFQVRKLLRRRVKL
jgi:tetratricopeptide (TPR) repeat protein